MIKLTEVVTAGSHYNTEKRGVESQYKLRNIYINPKFIISMTDNEKLNDMHSRRPIIDDLFSEAQFTRLTIASGINGVIHYDITGPPEQHMKKL